MATVRKHLTLEEFLKLPEKKPALEFEEGRVIQKALPKGKHSGLQGALVRLINNLAVTAKLAMAFPELRYTYAGRSYVPDVSVYLWDRIPVDDQGEVINDFFDPPDIAVEIVSPEQSVNDQIRRCLWYVENGTQIAVLLNPEDHSTRLFLPGQAPQHLHGTDRIDLSLVLPGFQLTVQQIFDSLKIR